jgi:hypothetical protein
VVDIFMDLVDHVGCREVGAVRAYLGCCETEALGSEEEGDRSVLTFSSVQLTI